MLACTVYASSFAHSTTQCASDLDIDQHCVYVLATLMHSDTVTLLYVQLLIGSTYVLCVTGRAFMHAKRKKAYSNELDEACA